MLVMCAKQTNKSRPLDALSSSKARRTPASIIKSSRKLLKLSRKLKYLRNNASSPAHVIHETAASYSLARTQHRKLIRLFKTKASLERDSKLLSDPKATFNGIRAAKRLKAGTIQRLDVGPKSYYGDKVKCGFFDAINQLKTVKPVDTQSISFTDFAEDYNNIIKLSVNSPSIPQISEQKSFLQNMKSSVTDLYSVTPLHYLNAGPLGWRHFHLLLQALIRDLKSTTVKEINATYAYILFKGHGKDKCSARSYRTISTCPIVAKGLDIYIRQLNKDAWKDVQPETQYQGEGSSHELAAVLLTECIQHSRHALKKPLYALYLDAKSAFDYVQKELLIKNLFYVQPNQSLLYLNNRLTCRQTYIDWNGALMGPVEDSQGLEQGGVSSSDHYKIFASEQLDSAQKSALGVKLGDVVVSAIGQADDTVLISNDIYSLLYLLQLTVSFCHKYCVELSPDKTRLQEFLPKSRKTYDINDHTNPIKINGQTIPFSSLAEHVGIIRSIDGNLPTLLSRFSAHKNALAAVLHTGLAKGHRGNPALSLRIHNLYGTPVLLSGIAPLVLSKSEVDLLEKHFRDVLRLLLRLHKNTPRSFIYFIAGSLPGSAILHLRQMSIFGMITRLPNNVLRQHALNVLSSRTISPSSWFFQIRQYCIEYGLPHPLDLLTSPLTKSVFQTLIKKRVISFWEVKLRAEATQLRSLAYFKPGFMSLVRPHVLWSSASNSPYKVSMATVQAQLLSGRYRLGNLTKHWVKHYDGHCLLSPECSQTLEDVPHFLQLCPGLSAVRRELNSFTEQYSLKMIEFPAAATLLLKLTCSKNPSFCQFLLDCSTLPDVISIYVNSPPISLSLL